MIKNNCNLELDPRLKKKKSYKNTTGAIGGDTEYGLRIRQQYCFSFFLFFLKIWNASRICVSSSNIVSTLNFLRLITEL